MTRAGNLTNKLGRMLKGDKLVFDLPEPHSVSSPRKSYLENREIRIRLALKRIKLCEVANVEGVHIERVGTKRGELKFLVNYGGFCSLDEAVARIGRIIDNRKYS